MLKTSRGCRAITFFFVSILPCKMTKRSYVHCIIIQGQDRGIAPRIVQSTMIPKKKHITFPIMRLNSVDWVYPSMIKTLAALLDLWHEVWRVSIYGNLPIAPVELTIDFLVLDVRTGTDIWTMTFGCHYPQVASSKPELFPIQTTMNVATNCESKPENAEENWAMEELFIFVIRVYSTCVCITGHAISVAALAVRVLGLGSRQRPTIVLEDCSERPDSVPMRQTI